MTMRLTTLFAIILLLASAAAAEAGTGELTVVGSQTSGDYGGEVDSDTQSTSLRFRFGNKTQFFADLDLRRVRSDLEFVVSPLGPIPARRRGPQSSGNAGPGTAPGPGPGSGPGPGMGSDGSGANLPTPSAPSTDPVEAVPDDWNTGLGDLRLSISQQILGGGAKVFRLDAQLGVKAPTGNADENLGTGEVDYRLGIAGNYRFWSMTGFGGLGWNALGDPEWVELADVFDAYLGVQSEPLRDTIVLSGWLEGNQEVVPGTGSRRALGVGARSIGKLRWRAQLTAGLGGSAENFSALAGVSFGVPTPSIGSDRMH